MIEIFSYVAMTFCGSVLLHRGLLSIRGCFRIPEQSKLILGVPFIGGIGFLWYLLELHFTEVFYAWPLTIRVGAIALYLAGIVVYVELRALLSRGYSLRIVIDLLECNGHLDIQQLKGNYGGGLSLSGLLVKRLKTLSDLGLLRFDGRKVGPLTLAGKACAAFAVFARNLLRLERVG
tara:strand:- start:1417 stop:1947 length:531 start_codon:yes stop_codon:yes gene_type:complete